MSKVSSSIPPARIASALVMTPARMYGRDSVEARRARQLAQAAQFKEQLEKATREAPPLTAEQVRELRGLLRGAAAKLAASVDGAA